MLTRAQKEEHIAELKEKFGRAKSVFVAEYRGLGVEATTKLRRKLRSEGGGDFEYRVEKNTLLRRAAEGSGVAPAAELFQGPTAIAISYGDPVRLAKLLVDYAKENEVFVLRGGVLDGKRIDKREVAHLATLPSLEQLRGKLVGLLVAPAGQLARLLAAPAGQLARVVEARRKALEEAGGASS